MPTTPLASHNQPEYSVSEISQALKRTVEDRFSHVRVRGEISGFKRAASGHLYLSLKDDKAVLGAVCWKGVAGRITVPVEDGMEVICTGKLSTYPGRSNYQLVIEAIEPAGAGALMALLEKRKKQLAAEGLFDPSRKQPLPLLPETIGVITSPTGAVIRDILHRISDRFPRHVLVWPVLVQGEEAAEQVAGAIKGFNALPTGKNVKNKIQRPDILIVARGGGPLEDLWAFNEEVVVRAIAASEIPIISAIGHETDTTLADYAADKRAPTPTAAAEFTVPVREEWMQSLDETGMRLMRLMEQNLQARAQCLLAAERGLPRPQRLLAQAQDKLAGTTSRLQQALPHCVEQKRNHLLAVSNQVQPPWQRLAQAEQRLNRLGQDASGRLRQRIDRASQQLQQHRAGLHPLQLNRHMDTGKQRLERLSEQAGNAFKQRIERGNQQLATLSALLESLNYKQVLNRGFVLVRDSKDIPLTRAAQTTPGGSVTLEWADGKKKAVLEGKKARQPKSEPPSQQEQLL